MAEFGPRPNTYTKYTLPNAPWYALDMYLRWEHAPRLEEHHEVSDGNVFLAMHFGFEAQVGGYIGLQQYGRNPNERYAIFSVWDHIEGQAEAWPNDTDRVEDGGTAVRHFLPYAWKEGTEYRLRVWRVTPEVGGERRDGWVGTVYDVEKRKLTVLGTTLVPDVEGRRGYGGLAKYANVFTEYFSTHAGCFKPYSRASWRGPYANGGSIRPTQAAAHYDTGCSTSNVLARDYPVVVHETGEGVHRTVPQGSELW